jgi:hypothetical protein
LTQPAAPPLLARPCGDLRSSRSDPDIIPHP